MTAQLLYEVGAPAYVNPDVVAHFDTCSITQAGENRVRVSGTVGTPPPPTLKVAMNYIGGFRNTMTMALTGLDIEEKAKWAVEELMTILGGQERFDHVDIQLLRYDTPDPVSMEQATAHLRVTVKDRDRAKVDRAFSNAVIELYVAGYAGFYTTTPPSSASEFGVYWPTLIPASEVAHTVVHADGRGADPALDRDGRVDCGTGAGVTGSAGLRDHLAQAPGHHCGGPLGDKGGNANVGVWTDTDERWEWLRSHLTEQRFAELVPECRGLTIRRFEFPNLKALNFVVAGFLGDGVASCTRPDAQAKSFGEYLRAVHTDVPDALI